MRWTNIANIVIFLGVITFPSGAPTCADNPCMSGATCVDVFQDTFICNCPPNFTGPLCDTPEAPTCADNPCMSGATCVDVFPDNFICNCPPNVTGPLCDVPVGGNSNGTTGGNTTSPVSRTCTTNVCQNGAACYILQSGGFFCNCTTGYMGLLCEAAANTAVVGCATNPCQNGGTCINTLSGYQCQCSCGFTGSYCQTNTALSIRNQCQPNPCQNGGTCYLTTTSFACACPLGYNGTHCEWSLVASNPCLNNPCTNMGTCQIVAANAYRCICPVGTSGVRCEKHICDPNPCSYQPCLNSGTCLTTNSTTFNCLCTSNYYGRFCEFRNYCQPNPCYNGGTCVTKTNAYMCQCSYPYSGGNCEMLATRPPTATNSDAATIHKRSIKNGSRYIKPLGGWEIISCLSTVSPLDCQSANYDASVALQTAQARYPAYTLHNDEADAFRHCFWSALMTQHIGVTQAKVVGDNHEQLNEAPATEHHMDNFNNAIGLQIGLQTKTALEAEEMCASYAQRNILLVHV